MLLQKQLSLVGTYNVRTRDRDSIVRVLRDRATQSRVDTLVTHEFPMTRAAEALELAASRRAGKIYLYPQD
jgi:threonine dehydrogenase-like Zn-dependent dehydrogenase